MSRRRKIPDEFADDGQEIPEQDNPEDIIQPTEDPVDALLRLRAEDKISSDELEILIEILTIKLTETTSEEEYLRYNDLLKIFHRISATTPDLPNAITAPIYRLADRIEGKVNSFKKGKKKGPPKYTSEPIPTNTTNGRNDYVSSLASGIDYNKHYGVANGEVVIDKGKKYLIMNGRRTPLK